MNNALKAEIGQRIKAEREQRRVSQEKLAEALGWNHHQIVGQVEKGEREVKAWELYEIAQFLHVELDVLLGQKKSNQHPYVLWRQKPTQDEKLLEAKFINQCDNYFWIEQLVSESNESSIFVSEELPKIRIDLQHFTSEQAYQLAEIARQTIGLGSFPANHLVNMLQSRYGVKFIVDDEIESPAACSRSSKGCSILINGKNTEVRQYFSIAHELFHLMTWDEELLKSVESCSRLHELNERLANAFAAGLLIPKENLQIELMHICPGRGVDIPDVVALAEQFQVSQEAMLYRLLNAGLISEAQVNKVKNLIPQQHPPKTSRQAISKILKSKYVRLVYLAYEHMKISRTKAAKLLNTDLSELPDLFNEYGFVEVNAY